MFSSEFFRTSFLQNVCRLLFDDTTKNFWHQIKDFIDSQIAETTKRIFLNTKLASAALTVEVRYISPIEIIRNKN